MGPGELEAFTDAHGVEVSYRRWEPEGAVRGIVLIAHGASEHGGRYARFAGRLTDHGFAVYAIDHRGHGATSAATGVGKTGPGGWGALVDDLAELAELARRARPGVPLVLFGHSMGSFVAQRFAQLHGDELAGLVLSGSSGALDALDDTLELLRQMVDSGAGDQPAPILAGFNERFEPARTPYDWLSRDADEVDRYLADPYCGDDHPLTFEFALGMVQHLADTWQPDNEARIPKDLPVLLITGEDDPVSDGGRTVRELEQRYRDLDLRDVTGHYVPGARHELLNEVGRDEVEALVVGWIERVTAR